jgi:hypothetical protein
MVISVAVSITGAERCLKRGCLVPDQTTISKLSRYI